MHTIRRLYFYAVAFISAEFIFWGLISLLRTIFNQGFISAGQDALSLSLASVLIGLPVFLIHWRWIQNAASRDDEENASTLRAVFLYAVLLATLIPVAHNLLGLLNRTLMSFVGLPFERALVGAGQSITDNLIPGFVLGIAAAYFASIERKNWQSLTTHEDFADVRRIYRYIWMLYGLFMGIFGIQQILRFIFFLPSPILGLSGRSLFVNGLSLLLVGVPIWAYAWYICQRATLDPSETRATLRLFILYILSLSGLVVTLFSAGAAFNLILRQLLGEGIPTSELIQSLGASISLGLPLGLVWAYYGRWLTRQWETVSDLPRRAAMRRLYHSIASIIGLAATFLALGLVLTFVVDTLTRATTWGLASRQQISGGLAALAAGLPLWLWAWRPLQAEALASGEIGDHARRSLIRRFYLYFVIFVTVIGGMVSAFTFMYQALSAILGANSSPNLTATLLNIVVYILLFVLFLVYHAQTMRADGQLATSALREQQARFAVLVLERENSGFASSQLTALKKHASAVSCASQPVEQAIDETASSAQAVILSAELALNPPEALRLWLKSYPGKKIIVPPAAETWFWAGLNARNPFEQAAQIVCALAEGQEVNQQTPNAPWMILVYVFAALFTLQIVFVFLAILTSLVFG